jgi:hypothetical protein
MFESVAFLLKNSFEEKKVKRRKKIATQFACFNLWQHLFKKSADSVPFFSFLKTPFFAQLISLNFFLKKQETEKTKCLEVACFWLKQKKGLVSV